MTTMLAVAALVAAAAPAPAGGAPVTIRYALIIANDHGNGGDLWLADLKHAESEARVLRTKLIEFGGFDPTGDRVVVVAGQGHRAIMDAAARLAELRRQDSDVLGGASSLFALFFSGHGVEQRLLTADDPLTPDDLVAILDGMSATLTVGVVDACYSGSFNLDHLRAKGMTSLPGYNPFRALPEERLDAEGTMLFVSSRPDQVSYEDDRLGGVFIHFFMEGLEKGHDDGVGVTVDEVWDYARERTVRHTAGVGRPQTPQRLVKRLKSSAPIYFAFPTGRTAKIVFDADVDGELVVRYGRASIADVYHKTKGAPLAVDMFPTDVVIEQHADGGAARVTQELTLSAGDSVRIGTGADRRLARALGAGETLIHPKGGGDLQSVIVAQTLPRASVTADLSAAGALSSGFGAAPRLDASVGARVDYGRAFARGAVTYGRFEQKFPAWSYSVDRVDLSLGAGPALDFFRARFGVELAGLVGLRQVAYAPGDVVRDDVVPGVGLGADALVPLADVGDVALYLFGRAALSAEWAAPAGPPAAAPELDVGSVAALGLAARLW